MLCTSARMRPLLLPAALKQAACRGGCRMSRMLADAGCHCRMSRTTCSHSITHTQSHANLDVVSPVSPVILFSRCWLVRAFVPVYQASSLYLKPRFPAGCPRSAGSSLASFMKDAKLELHAAYSCMHSRAAARRMPHAALQMRAMLSIACVRTIYLRSCSTACMTRSIGPDPQDQIHRTRSTGPDP